MKTLIILCPEQFKSFSKFSRKISRIIQNMDRFSVVFPKDPNDFIASFFREKHPEVDLLENLDWNLNEITHAIVFDDGEEFPEETEILKARGVPLRIIKILITRVVNIKTETQYKSKRSTPTYEYIGRGSYWGNPYAMHENGDDREEVIRKFKYDFDFNKFVNKDKSEVYKLAGKRLGCFCKPENCHGDVLADFLNGWDDGK